MASYIFITGGVVSSLGKGITTASLGYLLKNRGLTIRMLKIDPYLNVDPGTMSPYQHGEVYVTDDGAETDLDLGHYERFTQEITSSKSNITAGRVYWDVLQKERRGDFLGATIQMIPHISNRIKESIRALDEPGVDLILCELGGTVGDIEGMIFLEAIRQLSLEEGRQRTLHLHLTYVPFIQAAGEVKTKPTQQSVAKLREIGIQPDILICRTERPLTDEVRTKLSLFCNVPKEAVIDEPDVDHTIYEVPLTLHKQRVDQLILDHLHLDQPAAQLTDWRNLVDHVVHPSGTVRIGVIGKYAELQDAYKSIFEAIDHGGIAHQHRVDIVKIPAEELEDREDLTSLEGLDGLLVPGGFGERGFEGKLKAVRFARENKIPFFGICLGLQAVVVEYARHCCGLPQAQSTEFNAQATTPVVCLMEEQEGIETKGATMRLGAWECTLQPNTQIAEAYGTTTISERHRHRYEVNNHYRPQLEAAGLKISGINPELNLVETVELPDHPWFVATQFHPEFKSTPLTPHPLFRAFVEAAIAKQPCHS